MERLESPKIPRRTFNICLTGMHSRIPLSRQENVFPDSSEQVIPTPHLAVYLYCWNNDVPASKAEPETSPARW